MTVDRPRWLQPRSHVIALAALAALSPFSTDMYVSALPAIAEDLNTSMAAAQATLTAFLVGFAVGQLVVGPLSDGIGRRRVLLVGAAGFTLASLFCAVAIDPVMLISARAVQGVLGAGASIAARAMVGDATVGIARSRLLATLGAISSVAPVVAPLIGGGILAVATWRAVFIVLTILGAALLLLAALWFPETRSVVMGQKAPLRSSFRAMAGLLRMRPFRRYLTVGSAATIGFFTYISTSTFVFQRQYGFTELAYTVVFAVNAFALILTTLLFRRLLGVVSEDTLFTVGLMSCTIGSALVLLSAAAGVGPALSWPALILVTSGWGFVITGAMTLTQELGHHFPGSAAALIGGVQFGVGGFATPLAGLLGGGAFAMGGLMTLFLGGGLVIQLVARSRFDAAAPTPTIDSARRNAPDEPRGQ